MPPRAVLLDLYDTLVDGDWPGWRTQSPSHILMALPRRCVE